MTEYLTRPDVAAVAAAVNAGDLASLPILADALEEAGADPKEVASLRKLATRKYLREAFEGWRKFHFSNKIRAFWYNGRWKYGAGAPMLTAATFRRLKHGGEMLKECRRDYATFCEAILDAASALTPPQRVERHPQRVG